jgi:hypothetical protein
VTAPGGPWIKAAMFCDRVVMDGGLLSAQGIFEQRTITSPEPLRMSLLLILVRGDWQGPFEVNVVARSPSGEAVATIELNVDLPRPTDASGQVLVPISLVQVQDGVYWFELFLRGQVATRIPLRISHR